MTATPDLSPAEAARVAEFDRAPDLPESWAGTRERVARAIADTLDHKAREWYFESWRDLYLRYADAALAALTVADEEPWAAGYAQARDRLADQERRQNLAGLRDEVLVPGVERALLREAVAQRLWLATPAMSYVAAVDLADAVLALPELAALLDAAEKVRRVEALLAHPAHLDSYLEGQFRAALDGKP